MDHISLGRQFFGGSNFYLGDATFSGHMVDEYGHLGSSYDDYMLDGLFFFFGNGNVTETTTFKVAWFSTYLLFYQLSISRLVRFSREK